MRPLFAVQLLAGVTCVITFLMAAGMLFSAVVSANAISRFSFSEVELKEWKRGQEESTAAGMRSLTVCVLQGGILFFVSRHKKQLGKEGGN